MSEANVNKKRKNRWAFPLGLVITVFAVIGLVCVILAGVNATKKSGNQKQKHRRIQYHADACRDERPRPV